MTFEQKWELIHQINGFCLEQVRELHLICMEKNVWENEEYQTAMKLLRLVGGLIKKNVP